MPRKKVNTHLGKKTDITVTDTHITARSDVRSPFKDKMDGGIKLDAKKLSASAGAMTIELTGRGRTGGTFGGDPDQDGTLQITLTDPDNGDFEDDLEVTYVDDPSGLKKRKPKPKKPPKKKPAKRAPKKKTPAPKKKPSKKRSK